jgi:DNA polymerase III subunit gamma/tau
MAASQHHQVVALKYRPDRFASLVGQSQVATALSNAILQGRVGHAYLFTGARGVGKTSTARIFAKCLNCLAGQTLDPCGDCDVCQSVSRGEDVDVIEIDGASNRGIDEIRQLRANVNVRPARARYKIYIIDEVHMLTTQAFNALLKTLEEPPSHVKFIFCTTDADKIPVTVLSRCQRFDFPPIRTREIVDRLRYIVANENREVDDAALELLARRAGGSMRDSQSLLEQLLSYGTGRIGVLDVHALLGTADNSLVLELAAAVATGNASAALGLVDKGIEAGVDAGQLAEQMLGVFRDIMAVLAGCGEDLLLHTAPDDMDQLRQIAGSTGVESVLAILQVFDQSLVRLRHSTWGRVVVETAVVRCCHLQNLDLIPKLIEQLYSGGPVSVAVPTMAVAAPTPPESKKKPLIGDKAGKPRPASAEGLAGAEPAGSARSDGVKESGVPSVSWDFSDLAASWRRLLSESRDVITEAAGHFDHISVAGDRMVVTLRSAYDAGLCNRPEPKKRLEQQLQAASGRPLRLEFVAVEKSAPAAIPPPALISNRQRIRQAEQNEYVKRAIELFDGEVKSVKPPPKA